MPAEFLEGSCLVYAPCHGLCLAVFLIVMLDKLEREIGSKVSNLLKQIECILTYTLADEILNFFNFVCWSMFHEMPHFLLEVENWAAVL